MEIEDKIKPAKDYPKSVNKYSQKENKFFFEAANAKLEVSVCTDSMIRFRFTPESFSKDFSYAINPDFKVQVDKLNFVENEYTYEIQTAKV